MKIETLKKLIESEYHKTNDISEFKVAILELIDLYESDQQFVPTPNFWVEGLPDDIPYGEICSCNPKNGGSGICRCTMSNQSVYSNTIQSSDINSVS